MSHPSPGMIEAFLGAAIQALRAYQSGDHDPDLARDLADAAEEALKAKGLTVDQLAHIGSMRAGLLKMAEQGVAMASAEAVIDAVNRQLNDASLAPATSLYARALIARGVMRVAGDWWSDLTLSPAAVTFGAIASIVADPPCAGDEVTFIDPALAGGTRQ